MSRRVCTPIYARTPGGTLSSGNTQRMVDSARMCDQARVLAHINAASCSAVPRITLNKSQANSSGALELKMQSCGTAKLNNPNTTFPSVGTSEGARIQAVIDNDLYNCSQGINSRFIRKVPASTICPVTFVPLPGNTPFLCQPSRFFVITSRTIMARNYDSSRITERNRAISLYSFKRTYDAAVTAGTSVRRAQPTSQTNQVVVETLLTTAFTNNATDGTMCACSDEYNRINAGQ